MKEVPCLNIKIVIGYQMLASEMCVVHGEFPDL